MKYQTYSAYKDSGIEWLGEVPEHWNLNRFKNIFRIRKRIAGKLGFNVLSITQKGVKVKDTESGDGQLSMDYSKYQLVHQGDYAMNHMDLLTGFVDISKYDGVTSPDYRVFTLEDKNSSKSYYLYLLQLCYIAKIFYPLGQGAANIGRWRLPSEAFHGFLAPLPNLNEQQKIADFLDHETAKIDTLIEKQQQLIKLLKEKRQAVISHAVTKGLNPNAPMRDSGVEWLGEVPEHWSFAPLRRYLIEHKQGYYTTEDYVDDGVKLLRITDIRDLGDIDISDCPKVPSFDSSLINYELIDGDVVFARTGGAGSFGVVKELKERVVFASYLIRFRFHCWFYEYDYLKYMLFADSFQKAVKQNIHGGVNQNIHAEDIKNTYLTLPPLKEQKKIVKYLDEKIFKLNLLVSNTEQAIGLLKERRTALISAAVTGKIDVRNWQSLDLSRG